MSLEQQISKGIMEAMKAKEPVRLQTLRNIKKYIIEAKTAGTEIAELPDADVVKIIAKLAKQGSDSAEIYRQQNRADLAEEELAQVAVMQEFLPRQLSPEELTEAVRAVIAEVGARSRRWERSWALPRSGLPDRPTARTFRPKSGSCWAEMTFPHPHNLRTVSMPLGMVVGAMFCRPIAALETASGGMITPSLIFLMLFFTFCRVDVRSMRLQPLHLWLLTAQIVFSVAVYGILLPFSPTVAQGGMICVLTPSAMAAVVIGGMLGADIVSMTTFSLLCNMTIAVVAPFILSVVGSGDCSLAVILARVAPLLILPFAAAQGCRALIP